MALHISTALIEKIALFIYTQISYEDFKFHAQVSCKCKQFYNLKGLWKPELSFNIEWDN